LTTEIIEYIKYLKQQRYRSCIIHFDKFSVLSDYMKRCADKYSNEVSCFDIIEYFKDKNELTLQLDSFNHLRFFELLTAISKGKSVLIVVGMDLIFDTWDNDTKLKFYNILKNGWDSFKENYETVLIFCLMTTDDIKSLNIEDSNRNNKVKHLSEFKEIIWSD